MEERDKLYQNDNGEWRLYGHKIKCTQNGVQEEKLTDDIEFYEKFAEVNPDFVIDEVTTITYSEEQLARLGEVQGLGYKDFDEIYDYVLDGTIKSNSEIFAPKVVSQTRADTDYIAIMTGVSL